MAEILYKELAYAIVGAAMEVHRELGPGFLESVYQRALVYELQLRQIAFVEYQRLPVRYKNHLAGEFEADLVVDDKVILELKAVSALTAAHAAQAQHYLAATGLRLALLLNFGAKSLETKRVVK